MKQKEYERPVMRVVKLQRQSYLLFGSPTGDLGDPITPEQDNWE